MNARNFYPSLTALLIGLLMFPTNLYSQGQEPAMVNRTVGIVDPKAPVIFEDITVKTALANFKHVTGDAEVNYIIDSPSGGVAVFDYDNDGKPDIYLLNGSTMKAMRGEEKAPRAALYHNLGNFKFEDVTDKSGLANERWGMGVAVGDYENIRVSVVVVIENCDAARR